MLSYEKYGIKFIDEDHNNRFNALHKLADSKLDTEYSSCFYILSYSKDLYTKAAPCISKYGIKIGSLRKKAYSSSEEYLVKIAIALFNRISDLKLDFYWVVKFDEMQYEAVLQAFKIRKGLFDK